MNYIDDLNSAPEPRDIWVVAELGADGQASPLSLEILGGARMMADGLGCYVHAVVMGAGLGEVAPQLIAAGADRVHVADDPALAYADARCKALGDPLPELPYPRQGVPPCPLLPIHRMALQYRLPLLLSIQ